MKQIPLCPGYLADEHGVIWTIKRKGGHARAAGQTGSPRRLAVFTTKAGYLLVSLCIDGHTVRRPVHQLVLEAFVGPCPAGLQACHYPDADKSNNRPTNLRWDTHAENMKDRYRDNAQLDNKACRRCGITKPLCEFYRDKRSSDGLKTECKTCHTKVSIASRDASKKRQANRLYMQRKRIAIEPQNGST